MSMPTKGPGDTVERLLDGWIIGVVPLVSDGGALDFVHVHSDADGHCSVPSTTSATVIRLNDCCAGDRTTPLLELASRLVDDSAARRRLATPPDQSISVECCCRAGATSDWVLSLSVTPSPSRIRSC